MRDRLVELLEKAESAVYWDSSDQSFVNKIADFLMVNGVTIADGNNVGGKKPVLYSVTRGALCPVCDGNLDIKVTVKNFLRKEKSYTLRQQSNCCKHCGQPLDWGNEPPKEGE